MFPTWLNYNTIKASSQTSESTPLPSKQRAAKHARVSLCCNSNKVGEYISVRTGVGTKHVVNPVASLFSFIS